MKTSLITGGSRGIGRATALKLATHGFSIVITYASAEQAAAETVDACRALGVEAKAFRSNIADGDDRRRLIEALRSDHRRLDLLVNNAGMAPTRRVDLLEADEQSFDEVMAVNLKGPYFLTQQVARWMIEEKLADTKNYQPVIVNISSISAYTSSPSRGEYCLSKAAMSMMTKVYADRLAEYEIAVFEIRPGIIRTDMTAAVAEKYDRLILEEGLTPLRRWGEPEDVARAVAAVALGHLPFCTGQVIDIDGGFHLRRL